jgi:predicted HAD superfamily Cof-like phosphohydrolase
VTPTNAQRVRDFHHAVGAVAPDRPTVPDPATIALRQTLVSEEYAEVSAAFARLAAVAGSGGEAEAMAALVHELVDLLYVTYGGILACGVDPDRVFAEVHRANMAKSSGPRRPDGKQLKPDGWRPANVLALIRDQDRLAGEGALDVNS